jgi:hypothetical protein
MEGGFGIFAIRSCVWFTAGFARSVSIRSRVAVAVISSGFSRGLSWPLLFRQATTLRHRPQPFRRIYFCLVMCWSAMTPSSRRCRRFMMVRSWSLRGLCIFSKSRWDLRSKLFPHIASSLAMPHRMCRPPNRRARVVRRTPPKDQFHASHRAFQPSSCLQPQVAVVVPSPALWSPPDRRPSVRRLRRPTSS